MFWSNGGKKKSKYMIAGLAALMAVSMTGGTWAAWTQTLLAKNEFMTAKYSTHLKEDFPEYPDVPETWLPGEERKKEVWVENDSTIPVIAKITMNQYWVRREDVMKLVQSEAGTEPYEEVVARAGETLPLIFNGDQGQEYAAILNFNKDAVVVLADSRASEPGLRLDIPEVSSVDDPAARGKWLLLTETPDYNGNYTFYYMDMIQPGERTPDLLESVRLNPQLENTVTGSYIHYETDENGNYKKVVTQYENSKLAYDSSHFELSVTMETVQATQDAVNPNNGQINASTGNPGGGIFEKDRITEYIAGYIAGEGVYESTSTKKLYFEENNGIMTYEPYRNADGDIEEGNWFMSFTNMVPGGVYKDKLLIENQSRKKYYLYMKIIPRDNQTAIQDELLKQISMEIYYKDQLYYKGDATGVKSADSGRYDMQNLVPLGMYRPKHKEEIRVVLRLNPDLGLNDDGSYKYADVLTKIDWLFMVEEYEDDDDDPAPGNNPGGPSGNTPDNPDGNPRTPGDSLTPLVPKTGDQLPIIPLAVTAGAMLILMAVFGSAGIREEAEGKSI